MSDQEVELALVAQASEDQSFGERGIAGIERRGFVAQKIGGVAAGVNFNEDAKGNGSSGGNNDPSNGTAFGGATGTPDVVAGNPLVGSGDSRNVQIGLKITF